MSDTRVVHDVTDYQERCRRDREASEQLKERTIKAGIEEGEVSIELTGWQAARMQDVMKDPAKAEKVISHALNIAQGIKAIKRLWALA